MREHNSTHQSFEKKLDERNSSRKTFNKNQHKSFKRDSRNNNSRQPFDRAVGENNSERKTYEKNMRGIEAALKIYSEVQEGAFAAETIRKYYNRISEKEKTLAATLVYATLRRQSLWEAMLMKFCAKGIRNLPDVTKNALMVGTAGLVELEHFEAPVLINALVQYVTDAGYTEHKNFVNGVLHSIIRERTIKDVVVEGPHLPGGKILKDKIRQEIIHNNSVTKRSVEQIIAVKIFGDEFDEYEGIIPANLIALAKGDPTHKRKEKVIKRIIEERSIDEKALENAPIRERNLKQVVTETILEFGGERLAQPIKCDQVVRIINRRFVVEKDDYIKDISKSNKLVDIALLNGVPGWIAAKWEKDTSNAEAKKFIELAGKQTYMSLRVSADAEIEEVHAKLARVGISCDISPAMHHAIRINGNPYPLDLPGYNEGKITPQTESSMVVGETVAKFATGKYILDMCCGRGVKTGQIADLCSDMDIEGWDLSQPRAKSAIYEMIRMKVKDRVFIKSGDALELEPHNRPDTILLDAPCSGSGTWGRHPEGKWRCTPYTVEDNAALQKRLLDRAVSLVAAGGYVIYSTCSSFKDENEKVVASVLAKHPEILEIPVDISRYSFMNKGKPYGVNMLPEEPWIDGFYMAVLKKRN